MRPERILITGGCGFIGANLIAYLREKTNYSITVLDNESSGKYDWVKDFNVKFIKGDIKDKELVKQALKGVDIVVHLAADTRVIDSINDPTSNFETNVVASFQLLAAMRNADIKRFINASTGGAILGEAPPPVDEEMAPRPISPYGASKLAVEGYCSAFAGSYGMSTVSLRFSNVYGVYSYHKGSVIAHFFKNILRRKPLVVYGDGTQTRDYIFARDLCQGIYAAIELEKSGVYQLGTGRPTTVNELVDKIKKIVEPEYFVEVQYKNFRPGEIRHTHCNINKAKRDLGFEPSTDLEEGLHITWEWFKRNKHLFDAV